MLTDSKLSDPTTIQQYIKITVFYSWVKPQKSSKFALWGPQWRRAWWPWGEWPGDSRILNQKTPTTVSKSERGCSLWLSSEDCLQCRRRRRLGLHPWVGKIPWSRKWQPSSVFLPGKSHRLGSLAGYSPWGRKESDITGHASMKTRAWEEVSVSRKIPWICHLAGILACLGQLAGHMIWSSVCYEGWPPWNSSPHNSELIIVFSLWCSLFFYLKNFPYSIFPSETMCFYVFCNFQALARSWALMDVYLRLPLLSPSYIFYIILSSASAWRTEYSFFKNILIGG